MLTKDTLFKPSPQESRAGETDRIARGLIEDETNLRLAKQHRLRAARLEQEAAIAATVQDDPPGKAARRKRTKPRTPHS
ncbi:hypothetical protein SAMN05444417_0798 [Wenxinia saemankumensis]|uniref:Uncharacterized protein n=1 Tax=Wenxinia saemankumensis TaxID=1447782 RepID=A0A1M6B617_9RHOB|nr:hypothetical protein SAMN05444417_0798 [Wenxinia saemankumensis]